MNNSANIAPSARPAVLDAEFTHIAREVAGDHSVEVWVGNPGGGSYAIMDTRRLVLDPQDCADRIKGCFIAGHEGAHIADTPRYSQLGVFEAELKAIAKKLGFSALKNVIEDGAINDRMVRDFPGIKDPALASYPRTGDTLRCINHPDVVAAAQRLGFEPRYGRALGAILSDWSELRHTNGFGRSLAEYQRAPYAGPPPYDLLIEAFLKDVLPDARKAIAMVYQPGATAEERLSAGRNRHIWCELVLYPALEKLVEADLKELKEQLQKESGKRSDEGQKGAQRAGQAEGQDSESNEGQADSEGAGAGSRAGKEEVKQQDNSGDKPASGADNDAASEQGEKEGPPDRSPSELDRRAKEALAQFDDALREALKSITDTEKV